MTNASDRFMQYVDKSGPGGCWVWTGAKNPIGYGRFNANRRTRQAHRFSYEIHKGQIPAGLHACHKCDNPSCVNPDHLWLGTPGDNARDRDAKDRVQHGECHYAAKLTPDNVREIIESAGRISQSELAERFRVDPSNISHILSGKRWKRLQAKIGEGTSL